MKRIDRKISSGLAESEIFAVSSTEDSSLFSTGQMTPKRMSFLSESPSRFPPMRLQALLVAALMATAIVCCSAMLVVLEFAMADPQRSGGKVTAVRAAAVGIFVTTVMASLALGMGLSALVTHPLGSFRHLVELLSEPDITCRRNELQKLYKKRRSWIQDVSQVQDAFCHLLQGVEMFMRYVPDTVVRSIVRGDDHAFRLHVLKRKVTIMFSDIKDFTALSEILSQEDLLFVLTRYLSIMTKVVEAYQGVVAEILGDGLLVYWNTPNDVLGHEAKACAAAVTQQQVLAPLNKELARLNLPSLSIRIGLHTGTVLSGTIGSETKMKFGCLGDPVNLAARLEGLCKFYGVSVVCSGETYDALPPDAGFLCRQLDLVQVKGKRTATRIYEIIGVANSKACLEHGRVKSAAQTALQASTRALRASDVLQVNPLRRLRNSLRTMSYSSEFEDRGQNHQAEDVGPMSADKASEPVGPTESSAANTAAERHVELYEGALREYLQAHFAAAQGLLRAYMAEVPEDRAAAILWERVCRYLSPESGEVVGLTPAERAAWTGVTVLNDK